MLWHFQTFFKVNVNLNAEAIQQEIKPHLSKSCMNRFKKSKIFILFFLFCWSDCWLLGFNFSSLNFVKNKYFAVSSKKLSWKGPFFEQMSGSLKFRKQNDLNFNYLICIKLCPSITYAQTCHLTSLVYSYKPEHKFGGCP